MTASSSWSTRATLQAWTKLGPGRWARHGGPIGAWVGADGIGRASESTSKTPAGSWTVTLAFGRYGDPGTALRYFRTNADDYWISTGGSKYNTHQRCGSCGYDNGVNERLAYVNPEYNYAAVIDYNTRNAPGGVRQGAGSAFFLHVSGGEPTAGCVSIPQPNLVSLLRWMTPGSHPRILIGVT
ncbi:L,D-transpeptidase family protein [Jatrophihabitans fulvus]